MGRVQILDVPYWQEQSHHYPRKHAPVGYEVEKEPRYTVRFKGLYYENAYLSANLFRNFWDVRDNKEGCENTAHTRKELEANGFGWVFNCPGVEVKEVTDE